MKLIKKILPAAIAIGFAGAAQAQVSVYGLIDMSYGKNEFQFVEDTKADFHSGGDKGSSEGNSTTRFGIKGSTDVGSGVKANFRLESNGITSDGSVNDADSNPANGNSFFNRQAWLGFSGGFGEVRLGRQDSIPFQVMGQFDFNGQSNGVTTAYSGVSVWATGRQSRSLQYISPDMGGFKAHAGFVPKADRQEGVYSAALNYTAGAFVAGASFESKRTTAGENFASVAASYDFGAVKVMAGYTDGPGLYTDRAHTKGPTVGVVAPIAGFSVGGNYARDTENDNRALLELFVNKEIFKSTYGYVEAGRVSSDDPTWDGTKSASVGVIYVF